MTIPYEITVGKKLSHVEQERVAKLIKNTFDEIDSVYNKWNPESELSRLNRLPAGIHLQLSPELREFLKTTSYFVALDPRFDPAIEPIQQVWQRAFSSHTPPSEKELENLRQSCQFKNLIFDEYGITKKYSNTALDLGGIAKGFLVDRMVVTLAKEGCSSLFVVCGGEIRAMGEHPDHRPWKAGITNFSTHVSTPATVYELNDEAIATSGDYLQNWSLAGKTYTHIIEKETLQPKEITSNSIASATVVAPDCMTADALATMLLLCSDLDEAKKYILLYQKEFPTTQYYLQDRSGAIYSTM